MKRKNVKEYPETHQQGIIILENVNSILKGTFNGSTYAEADFGIQISEEGRVWICINGVAFIRFRPKLNYDERRDKLVSEAAKATEAFNEDELENFAMKRR